MPRKPTKPPRVRRNGRPRINQAFRRARLRRKVDGRSMSRPELARRASVSASYVFQIENTSRMPRLDDARRLAGALRASMDTLWPAD